jgi:hypothetical protein
MIKALDLMLRVSCSKPTINQYCLLIHNPQASSKGNLAIKAFS